MTADDPSTPLGRGPPQISRVVAAALAIFLGVFVLWAIVGDDPFGGELMVAVPIDLHGAMMPKKPEVASGTEAAHPAAQGQDRYDGPPSGPAAIAAPASQGGTKAVTIIDGKTGERQEVVIPPIRGASTIG